MAGARQHLLDDTDVHQCSDYIILLSYIVGVQNFLMSGLPSDA